MKHWLLVLVALGCLAPAAFADRGQDKDRECDPHDRNRHCVQQVPEGGSAAMYILGAGLTCLGALFLSSRKTKPSQS